MVNLLFHITQTEKFHGLRLQGMLCKNVCAFKASIITCFLQEVMLRRLKREVMEQLPPKRRQVVRLPAPDNAHWPKDFQRHSTGRFQCWSSSAGPLFVDKMLSSPETFLCVWGRCTRHGADAREAAGQGIRESSLFV